MNEHKKKMENQRDIVYRTIEFFLPLNKSLKIAEIHKTQAIRFYEILRHIVCLCMCRCFLPRRPKLILQRIYCMLFDHAS